MVHNYFSKKRILLCSFLLTAGVAFSQTEAQKQEITSRYNQQELDALQKRLVTKNQHQKQEINNLATQRGLQKRVVLADGGVAELQYIADDGSPIYYRTFNVNAAKSTRADYLNSGGGLGLNIDGQNMTAYVWDGGHARVSHQEYDGAGGSNRVSVEDAASEGGTQLNYHAAHVTGTIAASGVQANAKGMAPQSRVRGYMWNNDIAEATSAAANGMLLSNHSYGYRSDMVPDYYFGAYIQESRDWDELMYDAPFYLMVVAAGNDGNNNSYNGSPLNGNSSYDKLTGHSTSKNNLVVANAQDANIDSNGNLVSVSINSSSSEGPTDDLRIKPDITGNGTSVTSTYDSSDSAYGTITGTSMASPNVTGTLLLLQQHYNNLNGSFMRAATLKGLALHTADDAGPTGPDAVYGWGLLNAKRAAETISAEGTSAKIEELTLNSGQTYEITVNADGVNDLIASISWTDLPGTATTQTNSSTARLVNDLDIRVTQSGSTFYPYRLTSITSNGTGDNSVDPYERVNVANASGSYTITISHKGSLSSGSQNYSLILTGITEEAVVCEATTPANVSVSGVGSTSAIVSYDAVTGATYELRYRESGTSSWTVQSASGTSATLTGLTSETSYEVQVRSVCNDGSTSNYSSTETFTTSEIQLNYCGSQGNSVNDEYISRVQLGSIDNSSGAGNGYSDFTNLSTSLSKNVSSTISITPTWTGTQYNEAYSVWIDYNQDGDFNDTGEQVFTRSATQNSPVSGSFTVPSSALEGATRMRVSMKYNGIPTACESFSYGEVEDYTVTISGGTADTEAPSAPTNLSANNVTETTVDLSWSASTDNVGVTGYDVYQGSSLLGSVTGTTTQITGLTANTSYSFYVEAKDAEGNISAASNTVSVTTSGAPAVNYCASQGNNSSYEWIDLVALNGMSNATGDDGGYADYTNQVTSLPYGSNTVNISAGFSGSSYTEYWKIWIDYNKNGMFESSELMVSGSSSSSATLSGTFTVPTSALAGTTRMRVSMKYNAAQTACESFSYGEVEDYTVNIGQSVNAIATTTQEGQELGNETIASFEAKLYPNPVSGNILNVRMNDARETAYQIFDMMGKKVLQGNLSSSTIQVNGLSSGVYLLKLNDGQKEIVKKFIKQ
ncbi:GEVED domain-containing protein [Mesonia mobilis]|uniref:GEVED domain-containing protein n=1 Tax=Mesonia mobilis TaxID=369791 RepID=UPI000419BD91|nr:GEVED domain-containing protein [Mesonia mobilis]MBQ0736873.1 S8 family serine peptidase [Aquimarina celericrescens]